MPAEFMTALPFIIIGLVLLLLVVWYVSRSNRTTTVVDDETSGPGADAPTRDPDKPTRNQALIDSPKSEEIVFGTTSANANATETAMAGEQADAEAGVSVAPTVGDPVPPRRSGPAAEQPAQQAARETADPAPHPEARHGERTGPAPPAAPAVKSTPVQSPNSPSASATGPGDDLTRLKGLGPKLATMLNDAGITRFDQIANWTENDIARIDEKLGRFKGRIERDQWVAQARMLEAGDIAGFDARFGRTD